MSGHQHDESRKTNDGAVGSIHLSSGPAGGTGTVTYPPAHPDPPPTVRARTIAQAKTCGSTRSDELFAVPDRAVGRVNAAAEWRHWLTGLTMALLLYESLTGLAIYLLPFSVFNQFGVLWHTIIGVLMVVPVGWYLGRHWWRRFRGKFNHYQLLGYLSAASLIVLFVSGFILTWQAVLHTRISYFWRQTHLISGIFFVFVLSAHVIMLWVRQVNAAEALAVLNRAKRSFAVQCTIALAAMAGLHVSSAALYREVPLNNDFPHDYSWVFGKERPFAPSLVRTESNWAYDPMTMSGSAGCGSSGCHSEIYHEWEPSAHRYASSDVVFQAVQRLMYEEAGAEATRYCAGCHDPIALFSGSKNVHVDGLTSVGADEGVSCVVCHSVVQADVRGNADYTITQPVRYVGELHGARKDSRTSGSRTAAFAKFISDFLIRAYPEHHKRSFARPLYKTAEYCGACHKQFIDEEVNRLGWVQLQNQYDNWRKSRWYHEGDVERTVFCRECHMPLADSIDPAAGDAGDYNRTSADGKHRSHRFLGANQVIPLLMDLPGAAKQVELTEEWLRGQIPIPEIAHKWTSGPVIRLDLYGPESVSSGEPVELRVVLTNNKVGHSFPTGPMDIIRSWVEITVTDEDDYVVFRSGQPDERGYLTEDTLVYMAEGIDHFGNTIDRHNLWDMVGARFKRTLFPGMSDTAVYSFGCPGLSSPPVENPHEDTEHVDFSVPVRPGQLRVSAELMYQKADAGFLDLLFGAESGIRTPITRISRAALTIQVEP